MQYQTEYLEVLEKLIAFDTTSYKSNTKPNNYSIAHFRAVRDLMVSTCLAKLHQA